MSRPEEIQERIGNIRQIDSIVSTLRAIAAAHQVEARAHLDAIRAHEAAVAEALSVALAALSEVPQDIPDPGPGLAIVVGGTQGFCGAYADRLAEAARAEADRGARLMVVGARTAGALGSGPPPVWTGDMVAHAREIPAFAGRLADALLAEVLRSPGLAVRIVFADPAERALPLVHRRLFPFDFTRFSPWRGGGVLTTLAPATLVAALVEEYVFTEICEALMLGFAAENAARVAAMARARSNVRDRQAELESAFRRARQDQMTTEVIEVTSADTGIGHRG
ncbi:F0F1 ATP synthase subunit gamma [Zhengella sp. ZM62]|uniref:F0F1 ATP synthase subunit gamma n=1 Tax=Zhengella sedimenti TaxID=3390035 RepID=UPI003976B0AE